jgi:hypothetical protein
MILLATENWSVGWWRYWNRCMRFLSPTQYTAWPSYAQRICYAYNTSPHASLDNVSPFQMDHGLPPRSHFCPTVAPLPLMPTISPTTPKSPPRHPTISSPPCAFHHFANSPGVHKKPHQTGSTNTASSHLLPPATRSKSTFPPPPNKSKRSAARPNKSLRGVALAPSRLPSLPPPTKSWTTDCSHCPLHFPTQSREHPIFSPVSPLRLTPSWLSRKATRTPLPPRQSSRPHRNQRFRPLPWHPTTRHRPRTLLPCMDPPHPRSPRHQAHPQTLRLHGRHPLLRSAGPPCDKGTLLSGLYAQTTRTLPLDHLPHPPPTCHPQLTSRHHSAPRSLWFKENLVNLGVEAVARQGGKKKEMSVMFSFIGLSLFSFPSLDPMKQQQNYFDINSCLHWSFFRSFFLFLFPFFLSLSPMKQRNECYFFFL